VCDDYDVQGSGPRPIRHGLQVSALRPSAIDGKIYAGDVGTFIKLAFQVFHDLSSFRN
jgi:hypothetical protein